jgi:hypothetical protein
MKKFREVYFKHKTMKVTKDNAVVGLKVTLDKGSIFSYQGKDAAYGVIISTEEHFPQNKDTLWSCVEWKDIDGKLIGSPFVYRIGYAGKFDLNVYQEPKSESKDVIPEYVECIKGFNTDLSIKDFNVVGKIYEVESYNPKKEDFYNTKIDVSKSPELSRLVQEKLFELGFMWCGGANPYKVDTFHKTETILFIDEDNTFFRRRKSDLESGYRDIYPQDLEININKLTNNNNDTSKETTSKSISISKIQGFNQQITSPSRARGIGLTSSRSKITLGTVNKPNKVGLSTRK